VYDETTLYDNGGVRRRRCTMTVYDDYYDDVAPRWCTATVYDDGYDVGDDCVRRRRCTTTVTVTRTVHDDAVRVR
jgi:hypothetical protein